MFLQDTDRSQKKINSNCSHLRKIPTNMNEKGN